jgi:hypothetical protein
MHRLIFLLFLPIIAKAHYSEPQIVARLAEKGAWNAPDNMWCFTSEPASLNGRLYLGCSDEGTNLMAQWDETGFTTVTKAEAGKYFSHPLTSFNKISWYEYNEWEVTRSFELAQTLKVTTIKNLGPLTEATDSFIPFTNDAWIYRIKSSAPELWIWKKNEVIPFFNPNASFIFTPHVGPQGDIALKTREIDYNESSPDRLWHYNGSWRVILEDKDANPSSSWISFRHQLSVEKNKILTVARDNKGEALILIENQKVSVIARAGVDLASFDYFTPKMKAGIIVFRGEDFNGKKVIYISDAKGFRKLISEGDLVKADIGLVQVGYKSKDAIFYGAPGIDGNGNIFLQATLTKINNPREFMGIGILKFNKE